MATMQFVLKRGSETTPVAFPVNRMVNAGYAGRNQDEVRRHIEELALKGIPGPETTPTLYAVSPAQLSQAPSIDVLGEETSGEAEFVLLLRDEKRIYVAAGSDHTDRKLEAHSIPMAKQICPNLISRELWLLDDVLAGWDGIMLRGWVTADGKRTLYQEAPLASLMGPKDLLGFVRSKVADGLDRAVVYSGTISALGGRFIFGERFEVELFNAATNDRLSLGYDIRPMDFIKE
jgi:hypothetical protein